MWVGKDERKMEWSHEHGHEHTHSHPHEHEHIGDASGHSHGHTGTYGPRACPRVKGGKSRESQTNSSILRSGGSGTIPRPAKLPRICGTMVPISQAKT